MKPHMNPFGFEDLLKEIITDGPRGAILLSASLVDSLLVGVICEKMRPLTKNEHSDIFDGTGPLSTFSGRINVAYALGVYGRKTRHDLHSLRNIRNPFAHTVERMDLDASLDKLRGFHCIKGDSDGKNARELLADITRRIALYLIWNIGDPYSKFGPPDAEYR